MVGADESPGRARAAGVHLHSDATEDDAARHVQPLSSLP
jgi:hypothetical protein